MVERTLTRDDIARWARDAEADASVRVAANAVAGTDVDKVALDRRTVVALGGTTESKLDSLGVTDQKRSGRCWMFAALNVFRHQVAKNLNLEEFEFSESYLQFYDLLGKAEVFWDRIQEHRENLDSRLAHLMLSDPVSDGGEWNYVVALVKRYGLLPKYAMPETFSSSQTHAMTRDVNTVLRRGVIRGREQAEVLADVRRILTIHLGEPPESFVWQYRDKEGGFRREGEITPQEFAARALPRDLGEYVVLGNDPRPERAFGTRYAVDGQLDVPGAEPFTFLNAEIADLAAAARSSLAAEEPVWFACDVMRQFSHRDGVWDAHLMRRDALYGTHSGTTKAEQMSTRESVLTHAMVFTGFDGVGQPRWRVENSWGTKAHGEAEELGGKGYGTMSQSWFDDNVFAVVVHRRFVPDHLVAHVDEPATLVAAWDAMA